MADSMRPLSHMRFRASSERGMRLAKFAKKKALQLEDIMSGFGIDSYQKTIDLGGDDIIHIRKAPIGSESVNNINVYTREEAIELGLIAPVEVEYAKAPVTAGEKIPTEEAEVEEPERPEVDEFDREEDNAIFYVGFEVVTTNPSQFGVFTNYTTASYPDPFFVWGNGPRWPGVSNLTSAVVLWRCKKVEDNVINILSDAPDMVIPGISISDRRGVLGQNGTALNSPSLKFTHPLIGEARIWKVTGSSTWSRTENTIYSTVNYYSDIFRYDQGWGDKFQVGHSGNFFPRFDTSGGFHIDGTDSTTIFGKTIGTNVQQFADGEVIASSAGGELGSWTFDVAITSYPSYDNPAWTFTYKGDPPSIDPDDWTYEYVNVSTTPPGSTDLPSSAGPVDGRYSAHPCYNGAETSHFSNHIVDSCLIFDQSRDDWSDSSVYLLNGIREGDESSLKMHGDIGDANSHFPAYNIKGAHACLHGGYVVGRNYIYGKSTEEEDDWFPRSSASPVVAGERNSRWASVEFRDTGGNTGHILFTHQGRTESKLYHDPPVGYVRHFNNYYDPDTWSTFGTATGGGGKVIGDDGTYQSGFGSGWPNGGAIAAQDLQSVSWENVYCVTSGENVNISAYMPMHVEGGPGINLYQEATLWVVVNDKELRG